METPWIFGYGSLIWRPSFPYEERVPARLRGWSRRFWQGSTDHRGVPGAPGRVVTLVRNLGATCDGVAYRIPDDRLPEVLAHLDHREKGGYERRVEPLEAPPGSGRTLRALLFLATPENPEYLGPAPLEQIAHQVLRSRGPSGWNGEYLLELARALRELGARDRHVLALEACFRRLEGTVSAHTFAFARQSSVPKGFSPTDPASRIPVRRSPSEPLRPTPREPAS